MSRFDRIIGGILLLGGAACAELDPKVAAGVDEIQKTLASAVEDRETARGQWATTTSTGALPNQHEIHVFEERISRLRLEGDKLRERLHAPDLHPETRAALELELEQVQRRMSELVELRAQLASRGSIGVVSHDARIKYETDGLLGLVKEFNAPEIVPANEFEWLTKSGRQWAVVSGHRDPLDPGRVLGLSRPSLRRPRKCRLWREEERGVELDLHPANRPLKRDGHSHLS